MTPEKARKILKDGTIHGKPLTDKQRRYFGAIASTTNNKERKNMSKLTPDQKEAIIDRLITNAHDLPSAWTEDDREALEAIPEDKLIAFNQQFDLLENMTHEDDEEEEEKMAPKKKAPPMMMKNEAAAEEHVLSEDEFMARAPESLRRLITNQQKREAAEKKEYIKTITANKANRFAPEWLKTLDLEELAGMASLASNGQEKRQERAPILTNFGGVGGAFSLNQEEDFANQDTEMAVFNYDED